MLFRNTMILVLVVWLLVGWVRSHQDAPAPDDRDRRAHLKRRMLERLALRGYESRERERVAEELLARLESHLTSTSIPTSRHQRDHHRSLQRQTTRIFQDAPYPEVAPYDQFYPQLELLQEVDPRVEDEPEFEKVSVELEETKDVLREYLIREIFPDKTMERRHVDDEIQPEPTTRRSREERRREREEKKRQKEEKKRKRNNKKNKQRKRDRDFELFLMNQSIPIIHDVDGEKYVDCCPSKTIVVQKSVGKAADNFAQEIMDSHRTFYERVCLDEYLGEECIFPARSLRKGVVTRCTQEWSFTKALIRPYEGVDEDFQMGYVEMRSGCSCQVSLTHKKKRKRKR